MMKYIKLLFGICLILLLYSSCKKNEINPTYLAGSWIVTQQTDKGNQIRPFIKISKTFNALTGELTKVERLDFGTTEFTFYSGDNPDLEIESEKFGRIGGSYYYFITENKLSIMVYSYSHLKQTNHINGGNELTPECLGGFYYIQRLTESVLEITQGDAYITLKKK